MRPRIVLTGWPGAVLLSRGIVPFVVLLAARRGERSGTDMRWLFLVTATSARLWQRRFQCGGCVMLRERSLDVKLWRLVSRRNSGLQGFIELRRASVFTLAFHRLRD